MAEGREQAGFDCDRAIVHIDVDAFYAQVEEISNPSLKEKPLGVTQKYLVVTCNYPARSRGVTKMMSIDQARSICPELVLISGEDLTPYRKAGKRILEIAKRFGVVEKLGMDEVIVDVTKASRTWEYFFFGPTFRQAAFCMDKSCSLESRDFEQVLALDPQHPMGGLILDHLLHKGVATQAGRISDSDGMEGTYPFVDR